MAAEPTKDMPPADDKPNYERIINEVKEIVRQDARDAPDPPPTYDKWRWK